MTARPRSPTRDRPTVWLVPPARAGTPLQEFLREQLQVSNRQAKALIDSRTVFVNGHRVWMARHPLRAGDRVEASAPPPAPRSAIPVLYEDEWLVAVDKPPGVVTDAHADSLESRLREQMNLPTLRALHRLDRDTSGVLLFTRREEDREPYVELFRGHSLRKSYEALVRGHPPAPRFRLDARLDGKEAVTEVTVLARAGDYCRIRCVIPTGRTHQIRRHLEGIGCVIVGDKQYGLGHTPPELERGIPRQMLHAAEVALTCPHTARQLVIRSPLPEDFRRALRQFRL